MRFQHTHLNLAFVSISLCWSALMGGCSSVPPVGDPANMLVRTEASPDKINWPEQYKPEDATFFVHNEIAINASPQVVWDILIQAETWPTWYEGASDVKVQSTTSGGLEPDSVFNWRTMDLEFVSTIKEYEPPYRLSWESRKSTIQGYHAWLIVPTAEGCKLITDESQHGFLASMQGIFIPKKLRRLHDVWLAGIKARAEAGSSKPAESNSIH